MALISLTQHCCFLIFFLFFCENANYCLFGAAPNDHQFFFGGLRRARGTQEDFFLFFYLIINIFLIRQRERKNFLLLYFFDFVGIKLLAGNDRSLTVKSSVKHETFDVVC